MIVLVAIPRRIWVNTEGLEELAASIFKDGIVSRQTP